MATDFWGFFWSIWLKVLGLFFLVKENDYNFCFSLWYIVFSLEPHESLNEDIIIISDDDSDAADEDKEEE